MLTKHAAQPQLFADFDWSQPDRLLVVAIASNGIAQRVGQSAGHARSEVHSCGSQNYCDARGHVFAAVLAHALDHGERAAISNRESFAYPARDVEFAAGRAVQQTCCPLARRRAERSLPRR